jgi:hypothetical protein
MVVNILLRYQERSKTIYPDEDYALKPIFFPASPLPKSSSDRKLSGLSASAVQAELDRFRDILFKEISLPGTTSI